MLVVTLKYVTIIMRADNEGEGGIMALMALAQRTLPKGSKSAYGVGILGVFGAALFFGDGVITPAISVLSALEGLEVVAPQLSNWIVPLTVLVLVALRSAEHTSELQSLMRISYAVFCLKKKKITQLHS